MIPFSKISRPINSFRLRFEIFFFVNNDKLTRHKLFGISFSHAILESALFYDFAFQCLAWVFSQKLIAIVNVKYFWKSSYNRDEDMKTWLIEWRPSIYQSARFFLFTKCQNFDSIDDHFTIIACNCHRNCLVVFVTL